MNTEHLRARCWKPKPDRPTMRIDITEETYQVQHLGLLSKYHMGSEFTTAPSVAVFCPQSKAPQKEFLNELRHSLVSNKHLQRLAKDVQHLGDTWDIVASHREDIAELSQGPRYMKALSDWVTYGHSAPIANIMSGILSLPLLVVIQTCQYFQFLEITRMSHVDFLTGLLKGGGAQGYCAGLLPAFAIACAKDEEDLITTAAKAMRIALVIGAYGELGDDKELPGPTTIVLRLRYPGQGDEIVKHFPGAYISAITDPKTISITGPVLTLERVSAYAREQGLLVQAMHLRGKVHNPENLDLAEELCRLCDQFESLQFPDCEKLQIPVNSNRNGKPLRNCSLTHEAIYTILASRCEWYTLLQNVAETLKMTGVESHIFSFFGIGDPVPLAPFHQAHLSITKMDVGRTIKDAEIRHYSLPEDAVAIIGASCRLPGANSLEELWDLISNGASKCEEIRPDRVPLQASFRASQDQNFARKRKFYGNFVDDVDAFDHGFFRTNSKEATYMDPQQRILLELAYQAMDSSGYLRRHKRESGDNVGCFIGASFTEYLENMSAHPPTAYTATGTIRAFLCGKISYYFGWSGPSEVIDTACSSSLVAIHRACRAIQAGECPIALAGGVNIITGIHNYMDLGKAGFLSPTGQCKPFDASADGYCRADGAGLIVLKSLSAAQANGDQILGVITGAATNQGGLSSSITAPHSPSQINLYQRVLKQAGMSADHITYVEAHGTGTQAGDPLEIASIRDVFGGADRLRNLHIGSLKGNIGHSETAAGVAGLLKVLVMLKKGKIPPLASFKSLNPKIPSITTDKMVVAKTLEKWDAPIRAACVNSYGAAGSNAALLCCESIPQSSLTVEQAPTMTRAFPILITAASKESLLSYCRTLEAYLGREDVSVGDLAFTLSERRMCHRYRWTTLASNIATLRLSLQSRIEIDEAPQNKKRIVLAFGGQSKQTVGLDKSLYDSNPRLRSYIDACNDGLIELGFPSIVPAIFDTTSISDVIVLQTGTFAAQYACASCWIDAGLQVDALVGHSFGELTALVVSGVLSLKDGLNVIATRASLMASKWGPDRGTMLAIHASRDVVHGIVSRVGNIEVACYNAETSQVVVGSSESVARAESILESDSCYKGIRAQRLDVSHGFHSQFTEPLLSDLLVISETLEFHDARIPLEACTSEVCDKILSSHLAQHTRKPVYFVDAVQRIEKRLGACVWLEAGTDSPIIPMLKRAVSDQGNHLFQAFKFSDARDKETVLPTATENLWKEGIDITFWPFLSTLESRLQQIWLPPYSFDKTSAWLENVDRAIEVQKGMHGMGGDKVDTREEPASLRLVTSRPSSDKDAASKSFTVNIATKRFSSIVSGHAVRRRPLCPASMYMECATMAAQILQGGFSTKALSFKGLSFESPLGVDLTRDVSVTLEETDNPMSWRFLLRSSSKADPQSRLTTHGKGKLQLREQPNLKTYERLVSDRVKELLTKPGTEKLMSKRAYGLFSQVVSYAHLLRGISNITMDGNQALAEIEVPEGHVGAEESTAIDICDTVALDAFIQVVGLLINSSDNCTSGNVFVATGLDNAAFSSACDFTKSRSWKVYAMFTMLGESQATGDVFVLNKDDSLAMTIMGVSFTKLPIQALEKLLDAANSGASKSAPAPKKRVVSKVPTPGDCTPQSVPGLVDDSGTEEEGAATPSAEGDNENTLRSLISTYTGAPADTIIVDASMSDLGVDSLAAVELAEDLRSRFRKEISSTDLMKSNLLTLTRIFSLPQSKKVALPAVLASPNTVEIQGEEHDTLSSACLTSASTAQDTEGHNNALKIIAEVCGADISDIQDGRTLRDLGVDSLAVFQLKSDLGDLFSIEIGNEDIHLDLNVGELLQFLGLGVPNIHELKPANSALKPSSYSLNESFSPANYMTEPTAEVVSPAYVGNPAEALIQSEMSFPAKADRCGYKVYWKNVATRQGEILVAYIVEAFKELGVDLWSLGPGEVVPPVKYLPRHGKLMERIFHILQKHGILESTGRSFVRTSAACPQTNSSELTSQFLNDFPRYSSEARLMSITGPKLAQCLVGKEDPVALLFSNRESQGVLEDFYTSSPMLATLTELLVEVVRHSVANSAGKTVRIIELGAGFGGTTKTLIQALQGLRKEIKYTFTDVASTLVSRATKVLGHYDGIDFKSLNIERDPPASMKGRYDIAIGTNCVHATTNRTETVRKIKQLLNSEGYMILSEVTEIIDWYDVVYGLLDGWWLAHDGSYPLQPPESWVKSFRQAGFDSVIYSQGPTRDLSTQRLLIGSAKPVNVPSRSLAGKPLVETVLYKEVDGVQIHADIYLPQNPPEDSMDIAMMIHGGGHMTLSRKAVRPAQTSFLLANGVLPVSFDYRLCPEVNLIDGPVMDIHDAYRWARTELPRIVSSRGIIVDPAKIVVIGWSTGGHLAMTTAWTSKDTGLEPPKAILSFYSPTDFESGDMDIRRAEEYPERKIAMSQIIKSLPKTPITGYDNENGPIDTSGLGWVRPGDPRSELVLSLFKEGNGLPLLLNGISNDGWMKQPDQAHVVAISPMAQVRAGKYTTPTFVIHGTKDEVVPFHTAAKFVQTMREHGIECGLLTVPGARHIHDVQLKPGTTRWEAEVAPGYEFLLKKLAE